MSPPSSSFFFLSLGGIAPAGAAEKIHEVIKIIFQGEAGQKNRKKKRMAEMCVPKEPDGPDEATLPFWGNGGEGRDPGSWGSPGLASSLQGGKRVCSALGL